MLDSGKGTVAYHLRVLRDAGPVRVAELRQVRGGTEVHCRGTADTGQPPRLAERRSPTDRHQAR